MESSKARELVVDTGLAAFTTVDASIMLLKHHLLFSYETYPLRF